MREWKNDCGCFGRWAQALDTEMWGHRVFLGIPIPRHLHDEDREGQLFFHGFPKTRPAGGWKAWMLKRLDNIIRDGGVVKPYQEQMD